MAITIDTRSSRNICYEEFADFLTENIDMTDDDAVLEASESLSAFGNNKKFALEVLNREVVRTSQSAQSSFISHHSIVLGRGKPKRGGIGFAIRMNFWPTLAETSLLQHHRTSVEHTYSYGYPHDHNFTLLTVGFLGPGYETEIYQRDLSRNLEIGRPAGLKFLERTKLKEGRIIFFRKSEDIHIQIPPESISMSLNLLPEQRADANTEQYVFDVKNDITQDYILGSGITGRVTLIETVAAMGMHEAVPMLADILCGNEVPRVRLAALQALVCLEPKEAEYFYGVASRDSDPVVRQALF
ncbi:HEAT repeat domain-containing protein [Duganella sp. BuS-21]|uniref:HEAT repeat domain-containing protein n=1 Tax=Duganella sp. BuS-21 TaxID=2943848 RepID=UPI0035A6B583